MEAFTTAFFEAIHPFVAMFRDILDFFESATITEGPEQWVLAVGDVDLDLEHFRKWIEAWQEAGKARKAIPAIDWRGGWALWEILEKNKQIRSELNKTFGSRGAASLSLPDDVRAWVVAYDDGEYRDLPVSLAPDYVAEQLSQCALTAQAVLQLLQDQAMTP